MESIKIETELKIGKTKGWDENFIGKLQISSQEFTPYIGSTVKVEVYVSEVGTGGKDGVTGVQDNPQGCVRDV